MRQLFLIIAFLFTVCSASAQYGALRSAELPGIPDMMILRTSEDVLKSLSDTTDKTLKKKGRYIETVERLLESARQGFIINRLPYIDVQSFLASIKYLNNNGVDVSYYVEEYFTYYPRTRRR